MSVPTRRPLTYADLLAATRPDERVPELIGGEIDYKPSPRAWHSVAERELSVVLEPAVRPGGGGGDGRRWWLMVEPDIRIDDANIVRPDLAGWRRERMPIPPNGIVELAPDWVCEVLSPGHERRDRLVKMELYLRLGARWYWILSPELRWLEVFRRHPELEQWVWHGGFTEKDTARIPPFEEAEIELARLFVPGPETVAEREAAYAP